MVANATNAKKKAGLTLSDLLALGWKRIVLECPFCGKFNRGPLSLRDKPHVLPGVLAP